jgi:hypothetical protein
VAVRGSDLTDDMMVVGGGWIQLFIYFWTVYLPFTSSIPWQGFSKIYWLL